MANRLHERASKNTDPEEAKKQSAMANVFRRLAVKAAKQARNHVRAETDDKPTQNEPSGNPDGHWSLLSLRFLQSGFSRAAVGPCTSMIASSALESAIDGSATDLERLGNG